jgi:hypothetical protein
VRTWNLTVNIDLRTRQYIPEDSELHTHRCENLKSWSTSIWEHGNTSQKTLNFILTAVRTWNLRSTSIWEHGRTSQKTKLHTRCRENLKSRMFWNCFTVLRLEDRILWCQNYQLGNQSPTESRHAFKTSLSSLHTVFPYRSSTCLQ